MTIFGTFDPSIKNEKTTYGDDKSVSQNSVANNGQGTSQISFKGVEDLGGGLKASFLLENDFTMGTNTNLNGTGGEQFLALEGGFGKIAAGSPNTPSLTAQSAANPFGTKIGSGFSTTAGKGLNMGHVRNNNTVVYSTPVFAGFSAAIAYGFQTKTDTGADQNKVATGANTDIGLNYANGPLAAGVSFWNTAATTAGAGTGKNKEVNAYATYDLGVAKIGAGYYTEQTDNAAGTAKTVDSKAYNVSANVPLNANLSLLANYGKKDDKLAASNNDFTIAAIGLKYTLSKNTSVYARYVDQKTDNVANTAGSTTWKKIQTTLVGMQTNF